MECSWRPSDGQDPFRHGSQRPPFYRDTRPRAGAGVVLHSTGPRVECWPAAARGAGARGGRHEHRAFHVRPITRLSPAAW